jgi:hypothetical protein
LLESKAQIAVLHSDTPNLGDKSRHSKFITAIAAMPDRWPGRR